VKQIQLLLENIDMTKINEKTEESLNNLKLNNTNIYIDPGLGDLIKAKIHLDQMLNDDFLNISYELFEANDEIINFFKITLSDNKYVYDYNKNSWDDIENVSNRLLVNDNLKIIAEIAKNVIYFGRGYNFENQFKNMTIDEITKSGWNDGQIKNFDKSFKTIKHFFYYYGIYDKIIERDNEKMKIIIKRLLLKNSKK